MIAFGHTAVGAIVGVGVYHFLPDQPLTSLVVAGGVGIVSHYLADLVPHGHFGRMKNYRKEVVPIIFFDFLLSVAIFVGLSYWHFGLTLKTFDILFGIGGSQLPDILDGLIYSKRIPNKGFLKIENGFHQWTHWHSKNHLPLLMGWRDIWQVTMVVVALLLIIKN